MLKKSGCLFLFALLLIPITVGCSSASTDIKPADNPKTTQSNTTPHSLSPADKVPSSSSSGEITNNFTLGIEKRTVKKSIINDYNHTIDYDLNFVNLTGPYKGIDTINEYYQLKEKKDFFGKENNDWFNTPYPYTEHYNLEVNYQAEVQFGDILSIAGSGNSWAGGVNNPTIYGDVFDLDTGKKHTLGDIFNLSKEEYLNLIYDEVAKSIDKEIATEGDNRYNFDDAYSKGGQALIENEFKQDNFYLTEKSLVVYYQKYSLGDGAAGVFMFEIPLDSIKDKLRIDTSKIRIDSKEEYNENLCTENEEVLFCFKTENAKTLSICLSEQANYIVYRFGTKEKIELEFPENKFDSWNKFTYSNYLRGGAKQNEGLDMNYLTFINGRYEYQIYQEYTAKDGMTKVGVRITEKTNNKEIDIKGLSNTVEGSLTRLRGNPKITFENQ